MNLNSDSWVSIDGDPFVIKSDEELTEFFIKFVAHMKNWTDNVYGPTSDEGENITDAAILSLRDTFAGIPAKTREKYT